LIELQLLGTGPIPVVRFPSPQVMAGIWRSCRAVRERPAALVAVAVAMHVIAAAELGGEMIDGAGISSPISLVRALVGAPHGSTFQRRLTDLERAGLLSRVGEHWRSGAVLHLPPQAAQLPKLGPAPLQRVGIYAANDGPGPTLEEIAALDAEVAAAFRWRSRSTD
jgi:hypothetical protein